MSDICNTNQCMHGSKFSILLIINRRQDFWVRLKILTYVVYKLQNYIYISIDNGALGVCHDNVLFVYADIRIHILNCKNFKQTPQDKLFWLSVVNGKPRENLLKKKKKKKKRNGTIAHIQITIALTNQLCNQMWFLNSFQFLLYKFMPKCLLMCTVLP